jgi:hypothetical protein
MIPRYEIELLMAGVRERLDDEQVERIHVEAEDVARRWPGPDYGAEREAAFAATVAWVLGETSPVAAGADLVEARERAARAWAAARQTARMAVLGGAPEATTARDAGIDLMTLLRDLRS